MLIIPNTPNKCLLYLFSKTKYNTLDTPMLHIEGNLTWHEVQEIIPNDNHYIFLLNGGDKYITSLNADFNIFKDNKDNKEDKDNKDNKDFKYISNEDIEKIYVSIVQIKSITQEDKAVSDEIIDQINKYNLKRQNNLT